MIIYSIQNKIDKKQYIGKTTKELSIRWFQHKKLLSKNKHPNKYLQSAWNKYGQNNFECTLIDTTDTVDNLNELELFYIKTYKTMASDDGYNLAYGGVGGKLHLEVYVKLSNKLTGRTLTTEHKNSIKQSMLGRKIFWKDKISNSNKGKKPSPLAIQRSKELFTGTSLSEETKKKISQSVKNTYSKMSIDKLKQKNKKISISQKGKLAGGMQGKLNRHTAQRMKKETRVPKNELYNAISSGLTIGEISVKFNVGIATVSRLCKYYFNKNIKQLRKEI